MAWSCFQCGSSAHPGFILSDSGRMHAQCAKCGREDPSTSPSDLAVGLVPVVENGARKMSPVPPPIAFSPPSASAAPARRASGDRIAALIAEEASLEGQIATAKAKLAGVRAERKTLVKLLPVSVIESGSKN